MTASHTKKRLTAGEMSLNEDTELKGDRMKKSFAAVACSLLFIIAAVGLLRAQLAAPTSAGVSLGAVYYTVPDVAAHKKIWVDIFGAKPVMVGKGLMHGAGRWG